jgi:multidrug efflux pump subunit AcrA (membrane-fusion protein)
VQPAPDRDTASPPPNTTKAHRGSGQRLLGLGVLVLFIGALALGVWRHYQQHRQVADTAEHQAGFVPSVRVEKVAQRLGRLHVTLPATTLGFVEANIYRRASGYVLKRYVDIGDHVKPGVEAVIRVPAMPNLTFHGKVTRIADALQPETCTLLTEVDIANPNGALQPGVYCTVELKIPRTSPALIVSAMAIIFNQNGMQVAVVDNGVVHLHKIAITADHGTEVEVNSGVNNGDQVILQPPVNLTDGAKVQISPQPPPSAP